MTIGISCPLNKNKYETCHCSSWSILLLMSSLWHFLEVLYTQFPHRVTTHSFVYLLWIFDIYICQALGYDCEQSLSWSCPDLMSSPSPCGLTSVSLSAEIPTLTVTNALLTPHSSPPSPSEQMNKSLSLLLRDLISPCGYILPPLLTSTPPNSSSNPSISIKSFSIHPAIRFELETSLFFPLSIWPTSRSCWL